MANAHTGTCEEGDASLKRRWFMDEMETERVEGELTHPEELSGQELPNAWRQWIQICAAKGTFNSV